MNLMDDINKIKRYNDYLRLVENYIDEYEYMVSFSFNSNVRNMDVGWIKMGKYRELLERYNCYCKGYIVGERSREGLIHFHSLLYNCGEGFEELVKNKWSKYNGFVHIMRFEKGKGGEKYILKEYMKDEFLMMSWEGM